MIQRLVNELANGLQMGCKWAANGLQMGCKWAANGLQMGAWKFDKWG
jgi:hypothetical protein